MLRGARKIAFVMEQARDEAMQADSSPAMWWVAEALGWALGERNPVLDELASREPPKNTLEREKVEAYLGAPMSDEEWAVLWTIAGRGNKWRLEESWC